MLLAEMVRLAARHDPTFARLVAEREEAALAGLSRHERILLQGVRGAAWSNSKIFSAFITDALNNTAAFDLDGDTLKAALFDNTITPSQTVSAANSAYGAGVWASGGVSDASGWPAAGRALAGVTSGFSSNVYTFDAADTASANNTTTLTNATGTLVYEDTLAAPVADQGICYNYFGGANSISSGTFTIVWNASGILALTL